MDLNDFPDPLGIEDQWSQWFGTMGNGPPTSAEIFSREYIQNSWDSIQRKATTLGEEGTRASISFHFVQLEGADARHFFEHFGLSDHKQRLASMEDTERKGNRLDKTFLECEQVEDIRLLVAVESLAEGMAGKWDSGDLKEFPLSKMRIALLQSVTDKDDAGGTGGSWGEGKKAIAAASRLRILGTYTCHPQDLSHDPGITRRFMGITYWRQHTGPTHRHRGLGLLGSLAGAGVENSRLRGFEPLTNNLADAFVEELGVPNFSVRDPTKIEDHGTSYLIVDPAFSAQDLASAIARNWWPLLETHQVEIRVADFNGEPVPIEPRAIPELSPFIRAFDITRGTAASNEGSDLQTTVRHGAINVGALAIVSDVTENGWSYEELANGNADLIALIRNDMVIAYERFPRQQIRKPPYVRGALVVTREGDASEMLKMTEGHLHNSWKTDPQDVGNAENAKLAEAVLGDLATRVRELRRKISTTEITADFRLRAFQTIFSGKGPSRGSTSKQKVPAQRRDYEIKHASKATREYASDNPASLRVTCSATIAIRADHEATHLRVEIDLGWKVLEEAAAIRDETLQDPDVIQAPEGFKQDSDRPNVYEGTLTKEPVNFSWRSRFFPDDWAVAPDPQVRSPKGTDGT